MTTPSLLFSPSSGENSMKYILVTGGVISGVGKGVITSSLGVLLKSHGYRVTAIKIDPYLNIDAGTFSPFEHGEVFVLDDGAEVDLDLGNYERFLDIRLTSDNNITTGKIYRQVIENERMGMYMGKTVQMVPHVTGAIIQWIEKVSHISVDGSGMMPDVCIIELGGTIGDIEGKVFLSAFERFQRPAQRHRFMNIHVSLVLNPKSTGEPKTKPMQNSIQNLRAAGLVPDLVICRSDEPLSGQLRRKIADFGLVDLCQVIVTSNVSNLYKVPLLLQQQGVLEAIKKRLKLPEVEQNELEHLKLNMKNWTKLSELADAYTEVIKIALVGKYVKVADSYKSVSEALSHSAIRCKRKLLIKMIDSEQLECPKEGSQELLEAHKNAWKELKACEGIVVPGGFGDRGIEGMIACCRYAREEKIPFLGICLGMQCAAIEFARNVLNIQRANSTEFDKKLSARQQIVIDMPEHEIETQGLGGTMRLGKRSTAFLTDKAKLRKLYGKNIVNERHRHRYEVNPKIVPELSKNGLLFVGMGVDQNANLLHEKTYSTTIAETKTDLLQLITSLCHREGEAIAVRMEIIELEDHPYFVGVQYHPEYLSSPLAPSPPFLGLVLTASGQLESYLA